MKDSGATVRLATAIDAAAIAAVHLASWQAAYRGLIADHVLDGLRLQEYEERWLERLSQPPSPHIAVWVVEQEGTVYGFSNTGPCRDEDVDPRRVCELYTIYLHPDAWGRGMGLRLLERSVQAAHRQGFRRLVLWVLDTNLRARRFYEAAGFKTDGAVKEKPFRGTQLREVRYAFPL